MSIKWLHLSDIHLNKRGVETQRLRRNLLAFLKDNGFSCDYIFVTGDLRLASAGAFSEDTAIFLRELCKAVNVSSEKLFIVPGNHDINRSDSMRMEAVDKIWNGESAGYYNFKDGIIEEDDLKNLAQGKNDFINQIEKIYDHDLKKTCII